MGGSDLNTPPVLRRPSPPSGVLSATHFSPFLACSEGVSCLCVICFMCNYLLVSLKIEFVFVSCFLYCLGDGFREPGWWWKCFYSIRSIVIESNMSDLT